MNSELISKFFEILFNINNLKIILLCLIIIAVYMMIIFINRLYSSYKTKNVAKESLLERLNYFEYRNNLLHNLLLYNKNNSKETIELEREIKHKLKEISIILDFEYINRQKSILFKLDLNPDSAQILFDSVIRDATYLHYELYDLIKITLSSSKEEKNSFQNDLSYYCSNRSIRFVNSLSNKSGTPILSITNIISIILSKIIVNIKETLDFVKYELQFIFKRINVSH